MADVALQLEEKAVDHSVHLGLVGGWDFCCYIFEIPFFSGIYVFVKKVVL